MLLRRYNDRQIVIGLAGIVLFGIGISVFTAVYSIGRWRQFDDSTAAQLRAIEANTENIQGIRDALHEIGVWPAARPTPDPKPGAKP